MNRTKTTCIDGTDILEYGKNYYIDNEHTIDGLSFVDVYKGVDSTESLGTFRLDRFEDIEKEPNVVLIEITTCAECPDSKIEHDPDPYDSFCSDDVKCICKLTGEVITSSCRPYNIKKETLIPDDCPRLREMD